MLAARAPKPAKAQSATAAAIAIQKPRAQRDADQHFDSKFMDNAHRQP